MSEKIAEVRPNESIGTVLKSRTDSSIVSQDTISVDKVIDADAEQIEKIDQEIMEIWRETSEVRARYDLEKQREIKPLEDRARYLINQRKRLGPKPRCFGTFSQTVEIDHGLRCEGCFFASACIMQEKSTGGNAR